MENTDAESDAEETTTWTGWDFIGVGLMCFLISCGVGACCYMQNAPHEQVTVKRSVFF